MIKMVVSDMDGTLLQKNNTISERNLKAIRQLKEQGIEFAIASGRDYHSVRLVLDVYDLYCEGILGNGAQFCEPDGTVLMDCYLDKKLIESIITIFEEEKVPYMIYATDDFYTRMEPDYVRDQFIHRMVDKFGISKSDFEPGGLRYKAACMNLKKVTNLAEFLNADRGILKVEAFSSEHDITAALEKLKTISGISYMSSFRDNVEVTDQNAQKGLILEKVADFKGLSKDEIVVLGDAMNDMTLFQKFPKSCAPANAEEAIKKMAAHLVADCTEDGFAEAVDMILKNEI